MRARDDLKDLNRERFERPHLSGNEEETADLLKSFAFIFLSRWHVDDITSGVKRKPKAISRKVLRHVGGSGEGMEGVNRPVRETAYASDHLPFFGHLV